MARRDCLVSADLQEPDLRVGMHVDSGPEAGKDGPSQSLTPDKMWGIVAHAIMIMLIPQLSTCCSTDSVLSHQHKRLLLGHTCLASFLTYM